MVEAPRRLTWVGAAERVLADADHPLTAEEVARLAIGAGMIPPRGYMPEHSVQAAILRDLKRGRGPASPFVLADPRGRLQLYWHRDRAGE